MDVHILQHEDYEGPGHIADWALSNTHTLNMINARTPDFPDAGEISILIILGGAVNVSEEDAHPWLIDEKRFIRSVVSSDTPILGICLGSQLLANALGAGVRTCETPEIGWHDVTFDHTALQQAGLSHLPIPKQCLEWHGQTFDIPDGAVHLARSAYCANQAFMVNGRHIGLQFHPEWTQAITENVANAEPLIPNGASIQSTDAILTGDFTQSRPFLFGLLDHLVTLSEGKQT